MDGRGIGFSNKAIAFRVTIPDLPCATTYYYLHNQWRKTS